MTKAEHAERWAASIHEASHAVIHALHYRDRIRLMALDSGGRGVTRALTTRGESDPVKAAICCLAGAAGEHLFSDGGRLSRRAVGTDLRHAENHLRGTGYALDDVWPKAVAARRAVPQRNRPRRRSVCASAGGWMSTSSMRWCAIGAARNGREKSARPTTQRAVRHPSQLGLSPMDAQKSDNWRSRVRQSEKNFLLSVNRLTLLNRFLNDTG